MSSVNNYIAIDLGASSGRVTVSSNGTLDEIHRFSDYLINKDGHATWDIKKIWENVLLGLKMAVQKYPNVISLAIDSWGVDYVLLNNDQVIEPVYAYRDQRTSQPFNEIEKTISFADLYKITGAQNNQINTMYQLMCDNKENRLANATDFLFIPEYLTYLLTGKKVHEYTMASTSGLIDIKTEKYSQELISKLGLPNKLFCDLIKPGYVVGKLKEDVAKEIGANIPVVMAATHDTASAFYAVEADFDTVIISSGTWSLVGVKLPKGLVSELGVKNNFANESSVDFMCYLKNVMGLWLFNEVKKHHQYSYDEITNMSLKSTYNEIFDVNHATLLSPTNMIDAIKALLPKDKQPQTDGDLYRCIFRSLATAYRDVCDQLEKINERPYNKICIIGGGAKNTALNQFTKEIANREVIAIPMEATIMGNLKVQEKANNKSL